MSSHYNNEPPPTAAVTLHTTAGPLEISLFAKQAPLACKNFLQHCLDEYYTGTAFHRVVPDFVVQGGDPTGSGAGGTSIYEDAEFEYDPQFSREGGRVELRDEIHQRLRFNRRGLLGLAKGEDGSYGSQFFVTLADVDRELTGSCTMFGRLEGNSIYNVLKIAESELVEGTDRPVYAIKITGARVDDLGPFVGLKKRNRIAMAEQDPARETRMKQKQIEKRKKKIAKTSKVKLGFLDDDEDNEQVGGESATPAKPKFNTNVVDSDPKTAAATASHVRRPSIPRQPDPESQLPLPDPENPSRSPSPPPHPPPTHQTKPRRPSLVRRSSSASSSPPPQQNQTTRTNADANADANADRDASAHRSKLDRTNAEIARLKASLRRTDDSDTARKPPADPAATAAATALRPDLDPRSTLQSFVPANAIRGRKRPAAAAATERIGGAKAGRDDGSFAVLQSFREKLESADRWAGGVKGKTEQQQQHKQKHKQKQNPRRPGSKERGEDDIVMGDAAEAEADEEENVCDLHFIANCQSCHAWDVDQDGLTTTNKNKNKHKNTDDDDDDDDDSGWMTHALQFAKNGLGKDLASKRQRQEEEDTLVTIDSREERGGKGHSHSHSHDAKRPRRAGEEREQERKRKFKGTGKDWDRGRDDAHLRRM